MATALDATTTLSTGRLPLALVVSSGLGLATAMGGCSTPAPTERGARARRRNWHGVKPTLIPPSADRTLPSAEAERWQANKVRAASSRWASSLSDIGPHLAVGERDERPSPNA